MQYTNNYKFKKLRPWWCIWHTEWKWEHGFIDETLKNIVENVDIELNAASKELQTAIANTEALLESLVDNKIADHTANTNNPHKVTLAQVLGGGGSL